MKKTKKNITLDDLAGMVAQGFSDMDSKFDKKFTDFDKKLSTLEEGQEHIKLKLDNVAYRFELVELQKRVDLLEKHIGIKR